MRKAIRIITIVSMVFCSVSMIGLAANTHVSGINSANYKFLINKKPIDLQSNLMVLSKDNTTYVPLRFLSEKMDATVMFEQGTISIDSAEFKDSALEVNKKEIEELKRQISDLEMQNNELKNKLDASYALNYYKELPATADSGNGLKVTLTQISRYSDGVEMFLEIENRNTDKYFAVDAYKTEVIVNGKSYEASLKTEAILNSTLSQAIDKDSSTSISGKIFIEGLSEAEIKGNMIIEYSENTIEGKKMQISFDNTK